MKISVIGAGYVGLTTAACLSQIGHDVFCSESDAEKLSKLQSGKIPLYEPHLEKIVKAGCASNRLRFGSTEEATAWAQVIFVCVGTPPLENGEADLSAVEGVTRTIANRRSDYRLVIEKSTVPVQTGAQIQKYLFLHSPKGSDYDVASNPEFLREGSAVEDFLHPDRIVIGVDSPRAQQLLREIYAPIVSQSFACPVHSNCPDRTAPVFLATDTRSSELIKHASNSFLAMKISFINMVGDLCEAVGADVMKVAEGMGLDPRIGSSFLAPGIGFGGFCFPKDVQAFIRIAEKSGCDFSLLKEVENINKQRIERFIDKIREELWIMRGKKIVMLGLAFKPNTDDVRFAPSIALAQRLIKQGVVVRAYDPQAQQKAKTVVPEVHYCGTLYEAAEGAEAVLLVTEWDEFRNIDWERLRSVVARPLVIDGRNMFDEKDLTSQGFQYISIGRRPLGPTADANGGSRVNKDSLAETSHQVFNSTHP